VRAAALPAHEQATETVVPRVGAFHDPAPRLSSHLADQRLLATPSDVRSNSAETNRGRYVRVVVALVEAQVFWATRAARATHDDGVEHLADHGGVWHVRAADERCERHAAAVGQNVALYAAFRPVRRIRPREVPPFGAFTEALSRELHFHAMPRRPS
jgi:hypothetical protein